MGFGKDKRGQILYDSASYALGTLADQTALKIGSRYAGLIEEDFRISRIELWASWNTIGADDEGPLYLGLACNELSSAEIKECIESAPLLRSDRVEIEEAERPVWPFEILHTIGNRESGRTVVHLERKINWTFSNPDGWTYWVYNDSGIALTTGSGLVVFAKIWGVWVT